MTIHLTFKNLLSFITGACVVGLALITLLVDPQHLDWLRWQVLGALFGAIAIAALIWQVVVQSKEDHDRDARENQRDKRHEGMDTKLNEIAQLISKETQQTLSLEPAKASVAQALNPPVDFKADNYFRLAYQSAATADVEKRIRIAAEQNPSFGPPEDFYAKFIGVGLIAYLHDITWAYIWKSQFLMLLELNRQGGVMPLSVVMTFFTQGAVDYPGYYTRYTFDDWMKFMQTQELVIRHASDMVEITLRGRDFITYSAHNSRFPEERKG